MINRGELKLPKMDGQEVRPGVFLIGEPTPIAGTSELRCLANVNGALCVVGFSLKFEAGSSAKETIIQ